MKKILFPTDFSKAAETAQQVAVDFCLSNDAQLYVINIYQMPQVRSGSFSSSLIDVIKKDSHKKMDELQCSLSEDYPSLNVEYKCILGDPIQIINDISEDVNADMIVMGTHGASGLEEVLMGSNTQAVIKNAKTAVLAIPKNTNLTAVQNLGFASDLNFNNSSKAVETIKSLCRSYKTSLKIVHFADFLDDTEEGEEQAHKTFADIEHQFMEQMASSVENGIEDFIKYENINLLMMIHRKHTFWERLFTSSHSEKRAMHTKIPLLILKED